jgi:hypothetical protein
MATAGYKQKNKYASQHPVRVAFFTSATNLIVYPLTKLMTLQMVLPVNRLEYTRMQLPAEATLRGVWSQQMSHAGAWRNIFFGSKTLLPLTLGCYTNIKIRQSLPLTSAQNYLLENVLTAFMCYPFFMV